MKKIILSAIVLATGLTACNSNKDEKASSTDKEVTHVENQDEKQQVDAPQKEVAKDTTTTTETTLSTLSTDEIVKNYLKLKNALTKDDSQSAAKAAKALISSFNNSNYKSIEAKLKKEYLDIADDAKEHAEHIYKNAEDIEHQREHFAILSKATFICDFVVQFHCIFVGFMCEPPNTRGTCLSCYCINMLN